MDRLNGQSDLGFSISPRPRKGLGGYVTDFAAPDWLSGLSTVAGDLYVLAQPGAAVTAPLCLRGIRKVSPPSTAPGRSRLGPGKMERHRARALGRDSKVPRRKGLPPGGAYESGEKRPKLVSVSQSHRCDYSRSLLPP